MKLLAVIPHYRHLGTLPQVVAALRACGLPVLVVDDGSGEDYRAGLEALRGEGVQVAFRPVNGGKGSAMKWGFKLAAQQGFSHVLQMDADAQHSFADIPRFIETAQAQPQAVVCGRPVYGGDVPKSRLYGRKITDFWNVLHTWSRDIQDGMCGFRVYPLAAVLPIQYGGGIIGERMDFDNEILVRLHWAGVPFVWLDTPIRYAADGISHFNLRRDNWLISKMHARLFCGMFARRFGRFFRRPQAAQSAHWSAQRERGSRPFLRLTAWLVRYLPLPLVHAIAAIVPAYFYLTSTAQRRSVRQYQGYLKSSFPAAPLPARFAEYRQFAAFGQAVADRFAVWRHKITVPDLVVEDPDKLYADVDNHSARGQILICSHLGNIEVCRALVSHHQGFKLNVLVHNAHAEDFNRALKAAGASDLQLIQVAELDAAKMLQLSHKLDAGEWLAIAADRTPVRGNKTVPVQFLGHTARLPQGPWLLAGLLRAPTNTVFVLKERGRYHLCLKRFQVAPSWTAATRKQVIAHMAQQYADILAAHAARAPLQWFNFYDFWNDPDHG
ncbi:glycosyltransferase family 2 protein [Eikenella sp. S3360]|uniref:Glycosyltransferase family 2 protein n=1 Tax=Eikenella glucosivorans TaxID=2766967 RepID=A0ABS0N7G1_9NEIS|nr:glycosyltransferase family 2 protein [Eikenella glucosivorans]